MDVSREYIKMCEKVKWIQHDWKPQEGDAWACPCSACVGRKAKTHIINDYEIDALNKRDMTNIYKDYAKIVKFLGGDFVAHFEEAREGIIWLPRQDQLQDMVKDKYKSDYVLYFFAMFIKFWKHDDEKYISGFTSMEQLWLAFVMKEKYQKTWNGKEWVVA